MKLQLIKKQLVLLITLLVVSISFNLFAQENRTVYFYATGWEYLPQTDAAKYNSQPVVSNVVRINCKGYIYDSSLGVSNQLDDHYSAYHAKQRGFMGLNRTIGWGPFDTWEEAEKDRRKKIADYNFENKPLLLIDFRYLCDE